VLHWCWHRLIFRKRWLWYSYCWNIARSGDWIFYRGLFVTSELTQGAIARFVFHRGRHESSSVIFWPNVRTKFGDFFGWIIKKTIVVAIACFFVYRIYGIYEAANNQQVPSPTESASIAMAPSTRLLADALPSSGANAYDSEVAILQRRYPQINPDSPNTTSI
jgi:hypothetical protein